MIITRRAFTAALSLAGLAGIAGLSPLRFIAEAMAQGAADVAKPVSLPDMALGPADAKVTITEYASMTCPHCAAFNADVFPKIKSEFIDTGKIRYIFREFPLDNLAAAAAMLARCTGGDKTMPFIEVLFEHQKDWAFGEGNPVPKLFEFAKQAGFTQESFDKCLTDQKLLDDITNGRTRAAEVFGVNATPTFYINGKKLDGAPTMESFDKMIGPILGADAPPASATPAAAPAPSGAAPDKSK